MRKIILSAVVIVSTFMITVEAQDLPPNPTPGKCYVRCRTPEVWKNEDVKVKVTPEYKKIKTFPAEYKTVTERVMVKEAGKRLVVMPAVWETKDVSYIAKEDANQLSVVKATFGTDSEVIETKAPSAKWEMSTRLEGCTSSDPNDCRYWCYKEIPAEYETVPLTTLTKDVSTISAPVKGYAKTYKKRVMVTPPTTKEVVIPAEYKEIKRVVLVKDSYKEEVTVPATYKTVSKQIIVNKGGLTTWEAVDCKLVEGSLLPINWDLGSATLTKGAKGIIDAKLYPILNKGMSVVIESHTDSRGSAQNNQALSERRAQAVVNYLIGKKVNPTQLTANGLGESRLTNRCSDGVSCTEAEHRRNRRTTFRVINK